MSAWKDNIVQKKLLIDLSIFFYSIRSALLSGEGVRPGHERVWSESKDVRCIHCFSWSFIARVHNTEVIDIETKMMMALFKEQNTHTHSEKERKKINEKAESEREKLKQPVELKDITENEKHKCSSTFLSSGFSMYGLIPLSVRACVCLCEGVCVWRLGDRMLEQYSHIHWNIEKYMQSNGTHNEENGKGNHVEQSKQLKRSSFHSENTKQQEEPKRRKETYKITNKFLFVFENITLAR